MTPCTSFSVVSILGDPEETKAATCRGEQGGLGSRKSTEGKLIGRGNVKVDAEEAESGWEAGKAVRSVQGQPTPVRPPQALCWEWGVCRGDGDEHGAGSGGEQVTLHRTLEMGRE